MSSRPVLFLSERQTVNSVFSFFCLKNPGESFKMEGLVKKYREEGKAGGKHG